MKLEKQQIQERPRKVCICLARPMLVSLLAVFCLVGCKHDPSPSSEAPPVVPVTETNGSDVVRVEGSSRFQVVSAVGTQVRSALEVTGTVNPDVSREIPVLSLANGRVVALHVGLGDTVHKGQLVMEVQSPDVSTAVDAYLKAVNDEHLTSVTLERDKLLYDKGAIPKTQLEAAQDGEDDAKADLTATEQQLRILGVDKSQVAKGGMNETVKIYAPASGVIIAQNVTASGAAGITYAGSGGSLTIADLSHVWVICDVYENDLSGVHLGEHADLRLNAYPGRVFAGTISDIGAQLDPNLRTAKVRIQVENPDRLLRLGMFATGTLEGSKAAPQTAVPAGAILQLHDRNYVFEPAANGAFKRVQVKTGATLPGNLVVVQGIAVGQQVVGNALDLENTADQQ
jgi:cobalt-zinc-cadmium efflux system membrane fusion protein